MTKRSYKIFYTDDDEDDQQLFEEIISNINNKHEVVLQSHGGELMDMLKNNHDEPDVIFLDLNMPHKNGFQVLKEMKEDDHLQELPVVIFSTSNNVDNIEQCKKLGADGYICKPASYIEMKKKVESVLEMNWQKAGMTKRDFFYLP